MPSGRQPAPMEDDDLDENAFCPPALSPYALCILDDKLKPRQDPHSHHLQQQRTSSALGEITSSSRLNNTLNSASAQSTTLKPITPSISRHSKFMKKLGLGAPRRLTNDGTTATATATATSTATVSVKHTINRTPNKHSPVHKRHTNNVQLQKTPTKQSNQLESNNNNIDIVKLIDSPELGRKAVHLEKTSPRNQFSQMYNNTVNHKNEYLLDLQIPSTTKTSTFVETSNKFDHIQSLLEKKKEIHQLRQEIKQYKEELNAQRRKSHSSSDGDDILSKPLQINKHSFKIIEQIGKGGSSKVYKGCSVDSPNRYFAIKIVNLEDHESSTIEELKGEIKILHKLRHCPRVVKLLDYSLSNKYIHFVMECGELDLATVLSTRHTMPQYYDLEFIRYHSLEMIKCINTIHQLDIVHLDLKPANFVFVSGVLKLIDFGISNSIKSHTVNVYREFQMGTPNYMAPETLIDFAENENGSTIWKVGKPADIWSLGCILYQLTYGITPYAIYTGTKKILAITNPSININYPINAINLRKKKNSKGEANNDVDDNNSNDEENTEKVCPYLIDMIKKCLIRDPSKRITSLDLLNNIFVKPIVVDKTVVKEVVKGCVGFGSRHPEMKQVALGSTMKNDLTKDDKRAYERLDRLVEGVWKRVSSDKVE